MHKIYFTFPLTNIQVDTKNSQKCLTFTPLKNIPIFGYFISYAVSRDSIWSKRYITYVNICAYLYICI